MQLTFAIICTISFPWIWSFLIGGFLAASLPDSPCVGCVPSLTCLAIFKITPDEWQQWCFRNARIGIGFTSQRSLKSNLFKICLTNHMTKPTNVRRKNTNNNAKNHLIISFDINLQNILHAIRHISKAFNTNNWWRKFEKRAGIYHPPQTTMTGCFISWLIDFHNWRYKVLHEKKKEKNIKRYSDGVDVKGKRNRKNEAIQQRNENTKYNNYQVKSRGIMLTDFLLKASGMKYSRVYMPIDSLNINMLANQASVHVYKPIMSSFVPTWKSKSKSKSRTLSKYGRFPAIWHSTHEFNNCLIFKTLSRS